MLHYPRSTERAYVSWVARFIRHLDDERLERYTEAEIADFLTDLAVTAEHRSRDTKPSALRDSLLLRKGAGSRHEVHQLSASQSEYVPPRRPDEMRSDGIVSMLPEDGADNVPAQVRELGFDIGNAEHCA